MKLKKILIENPDSIFYNGRLHHWSDSDCIAFGYIGNKLCTADSDKYGGKTHEEILLPFSPRPVDRDDFKYPGRIFLKPKIISFWENIPKHLLNRFIDDIYKLKKIKIDDKWLIEIKDKDFQSISQYTGSENNFDMNLSHLQNPIYKIKNKSDYFGSNYYKRMSLKNKYPTVAHYTNAIHAESLSLNDILENLIYEQQRKKVVRNGKVIMKLVCPKNRKVEDGNCVAMNSQEISRRKRAAIRASSKRKSSKAMANSKRRRSLQKRKTLGL